MKKSQGKGAGKSAKPRWLRRTSWLVAALLLALAVQAMRPCATNTVRIENTTALDRQVVLEFCDMPPWRGTVRARTEAVAAIDVTCGEAGLRARSHPTGSPRNVTEQRGGLYVQAFDGYPYAIVISDTAITDRTAGRTSILASVWEVMTLKLRCVAA